MPLAAGSRLGPYEILALLGAGGMGEVYRARDPSLKRDVAVKVLPVSYSRDPDRLRRFELEAQAAAALNHPNILSIFHVGQQDGMPFIVSEVLEGESLRDRLKQGPLRLRDAVGIIVQVAQGLAAAHGKGIVHRDLKPENLFVAADGHVKILDFGLAKLLQGQPPRGPGFTIDTTEHTDAAHVVGTVGYMSPEQVRGEPADARSDIFALGCVLYETLSGRRAFRKATAVETMTAILGEDPPELSQSAVVPRSVHRVVQRCLEKAPERRFQSASDLAFALEALSDSESATTPAVGWARRRRFLPWTTAAVVMSILAGAWYLWDASRRSSQVPAPALEVRRLTQGGKAGRAAASPDGRYVAYVRRDQGESELRLLQVATERDVLLLPVVPLPIHSLHFSPDGNFIYFLRQLRREDDKSFGVFRIAALGGPATPLATDARDNSVTVSPDGKQIGYISLTKNESVIVSVDTDGGSRRVLARRPLGREFWFVEWSPSLDQLAAVAIGDEDMGLVTVGLPSGAIRDVSVLGWGAIGQPAWSADGRTIYAPAIPSGGSIWQVWAFDARSGAARPVTSSAASYLEWSLSATAAGDLAANTIATDTRLWIADRAGHSQQIDSVNGEGDDGVIWLDGKIVTSDISALMVHEAGGGNPVKLRSYSVIYRQLARCGPGRVAYWADDAEHKSHVARTDIATGQTAALTAGPLDGDPACTEDGKTLVYFRCLQSDGRCSLVRRQTESGESQALYDFGPGSTEASPSPVLSPDGVKVLFRRRPVAVDPHEWAALVPLAGGEIRAVRMPFPASEVSYVRWAPDREALLFVRHDENGVGNVWSVQLDGGGKPTKITSFESDRIFAFDVSPDYRLLMSRGRWKSDVVLIKNVR